MRDLWQSQTTEGVAMTVDELHRGARRLERAVGRRNRREYIAAAIVVIAFGLVAWNAGSLTGQNHPTVLQVGAGLEMAAAIFIAYHLHRQGGVRTMPEDLALTDCLQFHRRELERQRDLLRGVWPWFLLPCVPGLVVLFAGAAVAHPETLVRTGVMVAGMVACLVGLGELNRRVANMIQTKIDALANA